METKIFLRIKLLISMINFFLSLEFVVSKEKYWFFTSKLFKNSKIRSIFSATDYVDWISKNARKETRFFEDFCDIIDIRVF